MMQNAAANAPPTTSDGDWVRAPVTISRAATGMSVSSPSATGRPGRAAYSRSRIMVCDLLATDVIVISLRNHYVNTDEIYGRDVPRRRDARLNDLSGCRSNEFDHGGAETRRITETGGRAAG